MLLVVDTCGRTPEQVKRLDRSITSLFPASFHTEEGNLSQNSDGTYNMRCWQEDMLPGLEAFLVFNQCTIMK
jgi:hypothetical protein